MIDISISNIAWQPHEEEKVRTFLSAQKIHCVEIAPGKYFPNSIPDDSTAIQQCKTFWKSFGIHIVALQSLLFGHPEMKIFGDTASRANTCNHLRKCITLGSYLGVKALVFGSPVNRKIPEDKMSQSSSIAHDFFNELGDFSVKNDTCFCIEPNPKEYGTNFLCQTQDALDFVKIDNPGLKLNFDTGTCSLNKEDYKRYFPEIIPHIGHFHISEPFLESINQSATIHKDLAELLMNEKYTGTVSIEMKPVSSLDNFSNVMNAVRYVSELYR